LRAGQHRIRVKIRIRIRIRIRLKSTWLFPVATTLDSRFLILVNSYIGICHPSEVTEMDIRY